MTVTNEPGYYEDGQFGIRIENVMVVREAKTPHNFGDRGYLGLEHVTLVPMQTKMLDLSIMTQAEIAWVNAYNSECFAKVSPFLKANTPGFAWLKRQAESVK